MTKDKNKDLTLNVEEVKLVSTQGPIAFGVTASACCQNSQYGN